MPSISKRGNLEGAKGQMPPFPGDPGPNRCVFHMQFWVKSDQWCPPPGTKKLGTSLFTVHLLPTLELRHSITAIHIRPDLDLSLFLCLDGPSVIWNHQNSDNNYHRWMLGATMHGNGMETMLRQFTCGCCIRDAGVDATAPTMCIVQRFAARADSCVDPACLTDLRWYSIRTTMRIQGECVYGFIACCSCN